MPLSLIICYFIYKKIALSKVLRVIIYLPIIMTPTIVSVLFKFMIEAGGPLQAICGTDIALPNTFIQDEQYALKTIFKEIKHTYSPYDVFVLSYERERIYKELINRGYTVPRIKE